MGTLLGGCSSTPKDEHDPTKEMSRFEAEQLRTKNETMELLTKASLLAAKAQSVLAKTEQAYYQPLLDADKIRQMRFQNEYTPRGMEKTIPISWAAAPEPLLFRLATASGYKLDFANERPPIPEDVYINGKNNHNIKKLIDIITQQSKGYINDIVITDTFDKKHILVIYEKF
jgi:hypothetical protein